MDLAKSRGVDPQDPSIQILYKAISCSSATAEITLENHEKIYFLKDAPINLHVILLLRLPTL